MIWTSLEAFWSWLAKFPRAKTVRYLRAVRGVEKTSDGFRRKLIQIADKNGLNADYLASVISFETGGTFDPAVRNPLSGATGLIQFLSSTAKKLGTSIGALAGMTAEQQLDYVERYYQHFHGVESLEDHYLVVFAGGKYSPGAAIFKAPSKAYEQNKGLDRDGDGVITSEDATASVRAIYNAAESKAPIPVEMEGPAGGGSSGGGSILLVALGAWTIVQLVRNAKLLS